MITVKKPQVDYIFNTCTTWLPVMVAGIDVAVLPVHHYQNSLYYSCLSNGEVGNLEIDILSFFPPKYSLVRFYGTSVCSLHSHFLFLLSSTLCDRKQ